MPNFERLHDTDEYDLTEKAARPSKAQVLSYRKSKGALIDNNTILPPSPADSMTIENHVDSGPLDQTDKERDRITNQIERGTPGDAAIFSDKKTPEQREAAKRKSQFYNDEFAYREPLTSAKERIVKESVVIADIRTNVIVSLY